MEERLYKLLMEIEEICYLFEGTPVSMHILEAIGKMRNE